MFLSNTGLNVYPSTANEYNLSLLDGIGSGFGFVVSVKVKLYILVSPSPDVTDIWRGLLDMLIVCLPSPIPITVASGSLTTTSISNEVVP